MKLVKKIFNPIKVTCLLLIICSFIVLEAQENNGIIGKWVKLENDNKLSWENFYIEYKHETFDSEYSNLF